MKGAIYLWKSRDVDLEVRIQRSVLVLEVLFRAQRGTPTGREFQNSRVPSLRSGCKNLQLRIVKKTVYLSLGSNLGDRAANLRAAITAFAKLGEVRAVSSFYETEPVEMARQPWFLNCAVELETELMPRQLLAALLDIRSEERRVGKEWRCRSP